MDEAKKILSLGSKISEHKGILLGGLFADICLGWIPFVSTAVDWLFGLVLGLYFGSKKKSGGSELLKIVLPVFIFGLIDSVLSFLPACTAAALTRIILD